MTPTTTTPTLRQRAEAVADKLCAKHMSSDGYYTTTSGLDYFIADAIISFTDEVLGELEKWAEKHRQLNSFTNTDAEIDVGRELAYETVVDTVAHLRASLRDPEETK